MMTRWILLIVALPLLAACGSVNDQFVKGVDGYADVILPEYEKYVDADTALSPETKQIRKESSQGLRKLIQAAKDAK